MRRKTTRTHWIGSLLAALLGLYVNTALAGSKGAEWLIKEAIEEGAAQGRRDISRPAP